MFTNGRRGEKADTLIFFFCFAIRDEKVLLSVLPFSRIISIYTFDRLRVTYRNDHHIFFHLSLVFVAANQIRNSSPNQASDA